MEDPQTYFGTFLFDEDKDYFDTNSRLVYFVHANLKSELYDNLKTFITEGR